MELPVNYNISLNKRTNFILQLDGTEEFPIQLHLYLKKTKTNCFKWWFASKFFPFKIIKWE